MDILGTIWTTDDDHLLISIVLLNVVEIEEVVSIMKVSIFCQFLLKTIIHALKIAVLGGFCSEYGEQY